MEKIRFAIIGSGWRAEFYLRIAQMLHERMEVTDVLVRTEEKAQAMLDKFSVSSSFSLDDILMKEPDFVVLAIAKDAIKDMLIPLMERKIPVLCETPPANSIEALATLWHEYDRLGGKVQVAEQYFYQPIYHAWQTAIDQGRLGDVHNISISALHDYHAFSIIRRFLHVGHSGCSITAEEFPFEMIETQSRAGVIENGELKQYSRLRASIVFETGQRAFYDFTGAQYHSMLRARQLNVQGNRGEIDDLQLRYLNSENLALSLPLLRQEFGPYDNEGPTLYAMTLGEQVVYRSPFYPTRLNDDEIAIANCLISMGEFVAEGTDFYPLEEALQDTYLGLLMHQAAAEKSTLHTQNMPWAK